MACSGLWDNLLLNVVIVHVAVSADSEASASNPSHWMVLVLPFKPFRPLIFLGEREIANLAGLKIQMDDPNITMEEYIRLEEEKACRRGKVYNWKTATYDFENEFPAIIYNDALTSKLDFLTKPTVSPQHIDEFDLKDESSLSECDEKEQNVLNFNDLFPFNVICPNDSKSDKDNDDDKIDIKHSSGGNVINTDDGAYAHGLNKLLETSHDKSESYRPTLLITYQHIHTQTYSS
ncbi:hypothetical protein Tco_0072771 [Tanacetum coccineum]